MAGFDFVMVQLSKDGEEAAQGGTLGISNGRRAFSFVAGVAQRVERSYEWLAILKPHVAPDGRSLFELAPDPPAKPAALPVPSALAAPVATDIEEKK